MVNDMFYFKILSIYFIRLMFLFSFVACFIGFNYIVNKSNFYTMIVDNYKSMFNFISNVSYDAGIVLLVFLIAITELYKYSWDNLLNNVNCAYRDSILLRYVLSDEDLRSKIESGNDIYMEDRVNGLYAKLCVKRAGIAQVEFLGSGKIVTFKFKDLYKEIIKLCGEKSITLYDGDVLSYLYDRGFRMSKN